MTVVRTYVRGVEDLLSCSDRIIRMFLGALTPRDTVSPSTLMTLIWISSPMYRRLLGVLVTISNGYPF